MLHDNSIKITAEEQQRFIECCDAFRSDVRERNGIGTLAEKTLHAVLKRYFEPDHALHEQAAEGFVVDILNDSGVTEIQTAGFNRLRRKIDAFLPELPLRIVYPIPAKKTLSWYDPSTGEEISRRLSPKRGSRRDALFELYKIRPWLLEEGLSILLVYIDLEEHRLLDGWDKKQKRGSTRVDRLPVALDRIEALRGPEDYLSFVPATLPTDFTTKDFAREGGYTVRDATTIIRILRDFGLIELVGKQSRSNLYQLAIEPSVEITTD